MEKLQNSTTNNHIFFIQIYQLIFCYICFISFFSLPPHLLESQLQACDSTLKYFSMYLLLRIFSYKIIILLPYIKLLFRFPQLSPQSLKKFQDSLYDFTVLSSQASITSTYLEESPSHFCLKIVIKIFEESRPVVCRMSFNLDLFD